MPDVEVVIVGAGLAGLSCAYHLQAKNISFRIIEASDHIGGRVRTDQHQGFQLDRGFQMLWPAFSEDDTILDLEALDLRYFRHGALVRYGNRFHRLFDTLQHPLDVFSPIGSLTDKLRLAILRRRITRSTADSLLGTLEQSAEHVLRSKLHFSDVIIERFFRPFAGGVLLDPELSSSIRLFAFIYKMFAEGRMALPSTGMGAIPHQIAASLPENAIRFNTPVTAVAPGSITLDGARSMGATAVVVATEGPEAAYLVDQIESMDSRSVTCLYFAANAPPVEEGVLVLNGNKGGLVNMLVVPSQVASGYAPADQSLVSVSVLGNPIQRDADLERNVRQELTGWFGNQVHRWRHLRTYRILHARPFSEGREEPSLRVRKGLYVAGDHRTDGSIQGALLSGRRAAETLIQDLG